MLAFDDAGYWVRFVVHQIPVAPHKPHGLDYSLALHGKHRLRTVRRYDYRDAAALVADFWAGVEALMRKRGIRS